MKKFKHTIIVYTVPVKYPIRKLNILFRCLLKKEMRQNVTVSANPRPLGSLTPQRQMLSQS